MPSGWRKNNSPGTAPVPYQIAREGDAVVVYLQVQPAETNAASAVASMMTTEQPAKQIASLATTTPPNNSVSPSNENRNPTPAHLPSSNELTQPSRSSAAKSAPAPLPGIVRGQNSVGTNPTTAVISRVAMTQDAQQLAIRIEGAGLGRSNGTCSLVRFHSLRPSPNSGRVGSCISLFEACPALTQVTACMLTESPMRPLHRRLQQRRCLRRCFDCYRVERTSSRAGLTPAVDHHLSRRTRVRDLSRVSLTDAGLCETIQPRRLEVQR
jgi:hypothetical protein